MFFTSERGILPRLPVYKTVLCLTVVLILVVNGISLLHNLQSLKGANALLGQTARVGDRLQYLNVLVMDAESGMRGYFLSGSDAYLGPTRTAQAQVNVEFNELEALLADNPAQRKNLSQLRTLVNRRLSLMRQSIDVFEQGGLSDIVKISKLSSGRAVMDEIRLLVVIMVKEQNEVLSTRSAAFYQEYQKTMWLGIGINATAILVLIMFYNLVRRSFFRRAASELALQNANENLETMVSLRTEQLSVLSRHLIKVSEKEKAKLARELHDEMGANLTAISIDLSTVYDRLRQRDVPLAEMLARARKNLLEAVELKRRIVEDLRPSLLDNLGLSAALNSYCAEFSAVSRLDCEVLIEGEVDVAGPMHAIVVFRIVQESLNNISKYAEAKSVIVHLSREPDGLSLQIIDDGIGIAADALSTAGSHGLLGMRERALLLNGMLTVRPGVNARGTCVDAWLPIGDKNKQAPNPAPAPAAPASEGRRRRA